MIYAVRTQYNRTMARVLQYNKQATGEPLNAETLSLIAGNMNGERPNLISRVPPFGAVCWSSLAN